MYVNHKRIKAPTSAALSSATLSASMVRSWADNQQMLFLFSNNSMVSSINEKSLLIRILDLRIVIPLVDFLFHSSY